MVDGFMLKLNYTYQKNLMIKDFCPEMNITWISFVMLFVRVVK